MPAWEAVDLVEQLLLDMGSHLFASVNKWAYPMDRHEMYSAGLLARVISATSGKGEKPWNPEWPWSGEPKPEDLTPQERAALKAQLKARSAFGQKRTEA